MEYVYLRTTFNISYLTSNFSLLCSVPVSLVPLKFSKPTGHASNSRHWYLLQLCLQWSSRRQLHASLIPFLSVHVYLLSVRLSLMTPCKWPYCSSHSASVFSSAIIIWHLSNYPLILFSISHDDNLSSRGSGSLFNLLLFFRAKSSAWLIVDVLGWIDESHYIL